MQVFRNVVEQFRTMLFGISSTSKNFTRFRDKNVLQFFIALRKKWYKISFFR